MIRLFRKHFGPKPTWKDFLDRHPVAWGRLVERIAEGDKHFTNEELDQCKAMTVAALTDVADADAAAFIEQFSHFHPAQFLPENRERFPILGKIDALSPVQRTEFFVNVLRGLKLLRATGELPKSQEPAAWPQVKAEDLAQRANVAFLEMDLTKYPRFLVPFSSGLFNVTNASYAAAEITKGKMVVEEDLAIQFLQLVRCRHGKTYCFAKGLAKHLVSPYREAPSREYLDEFHATQAFLNDGWRGFGRQNAWGDFRHYLRKLMNKANAPEQR